jgi:tetrapyrrole methylase family protein/MazG family protein
MSDKEAAGRKFDELVALIARLRAPGGCPWDREQTHRSLKPMMIEEAYEAVEAIDVGTDEDLLGELGDLLLQVVFHSQIAAEEQRFTAADVIERITQKMVRRHPHVFGDESASTPGEVLRNWEAIKQAEARDRGEKHASMLDSVSTGMPAVMEAFQVTTKAARVGFEWPDVAGAVAKLREETAEVEQAIAGGDEARVADEVGDLLFTVVNVARMLGQDPESALKAANRKFRRRFRHVEERLAADGRKPADTPLAEMDALWDEAKAGER